MIFLAMTTLELTSKSPEDVVIEDAVVETVEVSGRAKSFVLISICKSQGILLRDPSRRVMIGEGC